MNLYNKTYRVITGCKTELQLDAAAIFYKLAKVAHAFKSHELTSLDAYLIIQRDLLRDDYIINEKGA